MPRLAATMLPLLGATLAAACSSPPGGFDSPEPSARLRATAAAAEKKDPAAVPHLIEQLASDDPLVRMASIRTLEEITGQTLGYQHWGAEPQRQKAIRAWVDWYNRERPGAPGPAVRSAAAPPPDTTGGSREAAPSP